MDRKFSVIIPVYNGQDYISRSINSVINQTYRNIQLIVVDDGSSDETQRIVESIVSQNSDFDFLYYRIENSGPSSARNKGFELATGDYVCFLDSDDYYDSDLFEKLNSLEVDYDICCFGWKDVFENGQIEQVYTDRFSYVEGPIDGNTVAKDKFRTKVWLCNCSQAYRRTMLLENGVSYPKGVFSGEDTCFVYSALMCAKTVVSLKCDPVNIVERENSLMHSKFNEKAFTLIKAMEQLKENSLSLCKDKELLSIVEALSVMSKVDLAKRLVRSCKITDLEYFETVCSERLYVSPRLCSSLNLTMSKRFALYLFLGSKKLFFILFCAFYKIKKVLSRGGLI